jgi:ABC-type multidrug transport system permease subunit
MKLKRKENYKMAKKYVININNTKINLAILDQSLQDNADLMIKYLCKETKAKEVVVRPIVKKYFEEYKQIDIDDVNPYEIKIKKFTKTTKIISKIAMFLLLTIAILVFVCYMYAKFNSKDQLFLNTIFDMSIYLPVIAPILKILKVLLIIFIISLILFIVFILIRRRKNKPEKEIIEDEEFDFSEKEEEKITVEDIFKDED